MQYSNTDQISFVFSLDSRFPLFDHLHNITNLPKTAIHSSRLGWCHAVRAADLHEVMIHGVKGEGVDMVFDLLAESLSEACVKDDPSIRVLGLFPVKDAFISTNYALREALAELRAGKLVDWQSRGWKTVKRMAKAVWRSLFGTYQPVISTDAKQVCSGATNEIFYKERH
jgi:hypothetical protein